MVESKQKRFQGNGESSYLSFANWRPILAPIPPRQPFNRRRELWLQRHALDLPLWGGMVKTVCTLVANRKWSLTGGRVGVNRARQIMQTHWVAPDVYGYRDGMMAYMLQFLTSDTGAIVETARGDTGALMGFLHVDATQVRLTGNLSTPLQYRNDNWGMADYWRFPSMPSTAERMNGLGLSATSMAEMILRTLLLWHKYNLGTLDPAEVDGFVTVQGMDTSQVMQALKSRSQRTDPDLLSLFKRLAVIGSDSKDNPISIQVQLLQNLPGGFDNPQVVMETAIKQLALILMYDVGEFWPLATGAFGNGGEVSLQHMKASGKGGNEFLYKWESRLNDAFYGLPRTVQLEYEERDLGDQLKEAEVANAWADFAQKVTTPQPSEDGEQRAMFKTEAAASMLVEKGVVDPRYTEFEEEAKATDSAQARTVITRMREQAMELPRVDAHIRRVKRGESADNEIIRTTWRGGGRFATTKLFEVRDKSLCDPATGEPLYRSKVWVNRTFSAEKARD